MNLCVTVIICLSYLLNHLSCLTNEERKTFLDIHNHLRRAVVPSAADMQELVYDENIELHVNEYLEQCKFEHRKLNNYGENGRLSTDSNIINSVMSWFQERVYFNISSNHNRCSTANSKSEYLNEVQCGHYQMMVKSKLKSMGCGYKYCNISIANNNVVYNNSFITFCFYDSGLTDQPYEIGPACSSCEADYQFCHNEMCVPKKRYSNNTRSCKLKCQNCGTYFDPKNSCLCDCPEGTEGNTCKGIPSYPDETCSPCQAMGLSCNGGVEIVRDNKCLCKCQDSYQGEYCEVRKDQFQGSYLNIIDGLPWRYNMNVPVDIAEFKRTFPDIQNAIASDIRDLCLKNNSGHSACDDITKYPIGPKDVKLIPGSLAMLTNGSLAFRMFTNYIKLVNGSTNELFVPTSILNEVWTHRSRKLNDLINNVTRIGQNKTKNSNPAQISQILRSMPNNEKVKNEEYTNSYNLELTTQGSSQNEGATSSYLAESSTVDKIQETSTEQYSNGTLFTTRYRLLLIRNSLTTKKESSQTIIVGRGVLFLSIFYAFLFL